MTEDEKKVQFEIQQRLMADIRRLREERDKWRERYHEERRKHQLTRRCVDVYAIAKAEAQS
jgi:hypothetical protein